MNPQIEDSVSAVVGRRSWLPGMVRAASSWGVTLAVVALAAADARATIAPSKPAHSEVHGASLTTQIDAIVRAEIGPAGPGCAVLVLQNGQPVHQKGYGLANIQSRVPVGPETVFDLASVSKHFTAAAVLTLVQRGRVGLDDDIRSVLPEFPVYNSRRAIRVRDLLNQVSGLKDYLDLLPRYRGDPNKLKNEDVLRLLVRERLKFTTGTRWNYSNSNYCMLALIVERLSGMTFGQFVRSQLYEPLGMTDSSVFEDAAVVVPNRARGYVFRRGTFRLSESRYVMTGDGGVLTNITDLVPWLRMLDEGGLVDPSLMLQMFVPGKLDNGRVHEYGFGWFVWREGNRQVMDHSGGWYGTSTYVLRYPDDRLAFAALSNNESFDPAPMVERIARLFLGTRSARTGYRSTVSARSHRSPSLFQVSCTRAAGGVVRAKVTGSV